MDIFGIYFDIFTVSLQEKDVLIPELLSLI